MNDMWSSGRHISVNTIPGMIFPFSNVIRISVPQIQMKHGR